MNNEAAIQALSALAQESRLNLFRLLVKAGPEGMAAGDIASTLGVAPNTLSAQLTIFSHAGLVRAERQGRSIIYAVQFETMRDLLIFLTEDCCGGNAQVCAPLADAALRCCQPKRGRKS